MCQVRRGKGGGRGRGKVSGEGREQNIAMRAMRLGMLLGMRECLPYIPRGMATDKGSKVN